MKSAPGLLLACAVLWSAGAAAQQPQQSAPAPAPAPARPATQAPSAADKPLDLRLNDLDRRPAVTFAPKADKKDDPAKDLPGLGGNPAQFLDHPSDSSSGPVIPRTDGYF